MFAGNAAAAAAEQLQEVYDIFALYPGQAFTPSSLDAEELTKQVTQAFHDPSLLKGAQSCIYHAPLGF